MKINLNNNSSNKVYSKENENDKCFKIKIIGILIFYPVLLICMKYLIQIIYKKYIKILVKI
jgi:hypothetical protein